MIEIIQKLIPFISISFSIYIYFMYLSQKEDINSIQKYMKIYEKHIAQNEKNINILNVELKKLDDSISNIKITSINNRDELSKKILELYLRWEIISDDRITSVPTNLQAWHEARQIIEQPVQKVWKAKSLSQTKDSFVNENTKYNSQVENEEEINQDFSEFSDEDFENIIEEDEEDSSSSTATDNTQNRKPKRKKDKPKQMKM